MPVGEVLLSGGMERNVATLVIEAGPVAKGILVVLSLFSVVSWAVILQKLIRFQRVRRASRSFWREYGGGGLEGAARCCAIPSLAATPLRTLLFAGLRESHGLAEGEEGEIGGLLALGPIASSERGRIERAMERSALAEIATLERHLPFLATTANVSPFLGLFGTVWGVMSAFLAMGAEGVGKPRRCRAGNRRGADHDRGGPRGGDPRGDRVQPLSRAAPAALDRSRALPLLLRGPTDSGGGNGIP